MNYAANVLLKPRRLISISHEFYLLLKNAKRPEVFGSKFIRIMPSSGCFLAGCCFSRQPENETLISNSKKSQGNLNTVDDSKNIVTFVGKDAHVTNSASMKRTSECVNEITSQNTNAENLIISQPLNKRAKTVINGVSTDEPETVQQKLSQSTNNPDLSSKCVINIVSQDANFEIVTSELSCKRAKHDVHESIPEEITVKPEIQAVTDLPSTSAEAKKKGKVKSKKQRPNYFVAMQISDDQILKNVKEVQNHIIQQDQRLKRSMIDIKTLHITLMVMFIGDPETHARAKEALLNVHQDLDEDICKNPLQLEFKGLSHFQNRVLYAKLSTNETYLQLCSMAEKVKKHFATASIETTDSKEGFTPHLTIAKIHFKDKHKGIKKINPILYSAFNEQYFGTQNVESIQLLSMTGPKTEAGYYSGDICYFSAFKPNERIKSLSKSLSVDEKKKDIKELINKLTKENMK